MIQAFLFSLFFSMAAYAAPHVVVDVTLKPAGDFKMKTSDVAGFAVIKGNEVFAKNIIVQMTTLKTGIALRDKHAKEKYLEVQKFPEAILVEAKGQDGKGTGRIKIKGIEKQISGTYKVSSGALLAEFSLKASDFGITGVKYMGVGVEDDIKIAVEVPVKK